MLASGRKLKIFGMYFELVYASCSVAIQARDSPIQSCCCSVARCVFSCGALMPLESGD